MKESIKWNKVTNNITSVRFPTLEKNEYFLGILQLGLML